MSAELKGLVENLIEILNSDSGEVANVLNVLDLQEQIDLALKFNSPLPHRKRDLVDIKLKIEAMTSLIFVLQNNPKLKKTLIEISTGSKKVMERLYTVTYELYESYLDANKDLNVVNYFNQLLLFSLNALIADKQTIADIYIKENLREPIAFGDVSLLQQLEGNVYIVSLLLISKISDRKEIERLNDAIDKTDKILTYIQEVELAGSDFNMNNAIDIGCLANILFVAKAVKEYLFLGQVGSGEWNIFSLIDTHCFNAIKLSENTDNAGLKKVSNLLKYGLERLCRNSVWSVVGKSPAIKKFVEQCVKSEHNILYSFLPTQRDSVLDMLTAKKCIVLNMPTSSGKSLLAELYILYIMHNFKEERPTVCYVVPTNALINQVSRRLKENFIDFGFQIETVLPFYSVDAIEDQVLKDHHIDILVSTPEKLDFLIRQQHQVIANLKLIVLDEAHNISDQDRGSKFELLLATLKQKKRDVNYLLLSPFIGNSKEIAKWLGDTEQDSLAIGLQWSPTKQYIGCNLLKHNKNKSTVKYFPSARNNIVKQPFEVEINNNVPKVLEELGESSLDYKAKNIILLEKYLRLGTVMVLCKGVGSCQKLALSALAYFKETGILSDISAEEEINKVVELIKLELTVDDDLIECLRYGIAYHHARLPSLVKEYIEDLIPRKGLIKIVCATTTLAQGMNFPITTVIFNSLTVGAESKSLTGSEFWNIAGRAGRAYMDKEGHVITPSLKTQASSIAAVEEYIKHDIGELTSSLRDFFEDLGDDVLFDYQFIKKNLAASNFLQYLSHILNVTYNYNLDKLDTTLIRQILNTSLVYKELELEEGFIESQQKISDFAYKYILHLKGVKKNQLKLADIFGVSDISYRTISGLVQHFKNEIVESYGELRKDEYIKASRIILESKDVHKLTPIIELISRIPEIKMELYGYGNFNPENIAKIIIGWVNGERVNDIAKEIKYEGVDYKEILGRCFNYVNGNLRSFVPWGLVIYQSLTDDMNSQGASNLPSFVYYGVNNVESVVFSKAGVPRFAVNRVKEVVKTHYPQIRIAIDNISALRQAIYQISEDNYSFGDIDSRVVKEIIDRHLK